jgi:DNA-binding HxlR family transcriptional regulator
MSLDHHNLPVADESITTIDEWEEEINDYLGRKYAIVLLSKLNTRGGLRVEHLKKILPGSPSTISKRKSEAARLGLIEPSLRNTEKGYGSHTYYILTEVGAHYLFELENTGVLELYYRLKSVEQQFDATKSSIKTNGISLPDDLLDQPSTDHE